METIGAKRKAGAVAARYVLNKGNKTETVFAADANCVQEAQVRAGSEGSSKEKIQCDKSHIVQKHLQLELSECSRLVERNKLDRIHDWIKRKEQDATRSSRSALASIKRGLRSTSQSDSSKKWRRRPSTEPIKRSLHQNAGLSNIRYREYLEAVKWLRCSYFHNMGKAPSSVDEDELLRCFQFLFNHRFSCPPCI